MKSLLLFAFLSALAVLASESTAQQPLDSCTGPLCGCGIDHSDIAGKASYNASIISSGGNRSFLIHVPSNYNPKTPTGMILSYHGAHRNSTNQEELSQFSNETINPDWIAVYPQGLNNTWQGPDYAVPNVSDVQFTADLLHYMRQNYCIDKTRVYAAGKSNGGGFCGTLACDANVGQYFAAFAPVSGAFYTDVNRNSPCSPARVLPILEFHGLNDTTICYEGGHGVPVTPGSKTKVCHPHGCSETDGKCVGPVPNWLHRWATRDGCSGEPPSNATTVNGNVTHTTWSCGQNTDIVQNYLINGLGHVWPSTSWNPDNNGTVSVINASPIIMDFFRSHTRPI